MGNIPNLRIQDDLTNVAFIDQDIKEKAMKINLKRQKINALMMHIVGAILEDNNTLNEKRKKIAVFLIKRVNYTMW